MRFPDVKPSVFAPRRGGRRGGFPKGAALKSAPETPKKRAKYSLSRREARTDLYEARATRAPVSAAGRGRGLWGQSGGSGQLRRWDIGAGGQNGGGGKLHGWNIGAGRQKGGRGPRGEFGLWAPAWTIGSLGQPGLLGLSAEKGGEEMEKRESKVLIWNREKSGSELKTSNRRFKMGFARRFWMRSHRFGTNGNLNKNDLNF